MSNQFEEKPRIYMTKEQFDEIEKENHEVMKVWPKNFPYYCHTIEELRNMIEFSRKNQKLCKEMAERYKTLCEECGFVRVHGNIKCENCGHTIKVYQWETK